MKIAADFSFSSITQVASRPTVTPPPPPAFTTTPPPATTTSPPPSLAPAPAKPAAPPALPLRQYRFLPYWECVNRLLDLQRSNPSSPPSLLPSFPPSLLSPSLSLPLSLSPSLACSLLARSLARCVSCWESIGGVLDEPTSTNPRLLTQVH
jgi:hypothetical protein